MMEFSLKENPSKNTQLMEKFGYVQTNVNNLAGILVRSNQINLYTWLSSIVFSEDRHDFYHHIAFHTLCKQGDEGIKVRFTTRGSVFHSRQNFELRAIKINIFQIEGD